jgi:hypothetical protein
MGVNALNTTLADSQELTAPLARRAAPRSGRATPQAIGRTAKVWRLIGIFGFFG